MNCNEFQAALEASRDGAGADLSAHAAACPACARVLEQELQLRDAMACLRDASGRTRVPTGFARRVRNARIAARERPQLQQRGWSLLLAAAAAAAVLTAAFLVVGDASTPPGVAAGSGATPAASSSPSSGFQPVVWSDGGVDVIAPAEVEANPAAVAVLVEWDL